MLPAQVIAPHMPRMLSFAVGATMYGVVEGLIPEARLGGRSNIGAMGVTAAF